MYKTLNSKLVLILIVFIIAVMATVGIFLMNSVSDFYTDEFIDCGDGTVLQTGNPVEREFNDLTVDIDAVRNGYVSVTPITACKTDLTVFENIKDI